MPICTQCKTEYREGFKTCSDCNVELIEDEKNYRREDTNIKDDLEVELVFLKSVSDGFERDTITSLLESNDIEVLEKERGVGQIMKIYTGKNFYGIDLYVPKHQLKKAQELIEFLKTNIKEDVLEED